MSNLYRGPSIDARQFLFLIGRFLKIFYSETAWLNGPKHGREHLWKVLYGNCSFCFDPLTNMAVIDNSCFLLSKSTNQKQELSMEAMFVNGSGRNEQSQQRTFHRCFLPSFGSFSQTVSEEKNLKNQPIRNKNRLWTNMATTGDSCFWLADF
jgi:hypothetical protein